MLCLLGGLAYGGWEAYTIYLAPAEEAAAVKPVVEAAACVPCHLVSEERRLYVALRMEEHLSRVLGSRNQAQAQGTVQRVGGRRRGWCQGLGCC